jgi:septal ring-binding cell division protein DamX
VFSQQDKKQIIGRIHRLPQQHVCVVYDLVLKHTSDEALYAMACGKAEMMASLSGQTVEDIMHSTAYIEDVDDVEDDIDISMDNHDPFVSQVRRKYRIASSKTLSKRQDKHVPKISRSKPHESINESLSCQAAQNVSIDWQNILHLGFQAIEGSTVQRGSETVAFARGSQLSETEQQSINSNRNNQEAGNVIDDDEIEVGRLSSEDFLDDIDMELVLRLGFESITPSGEFVLSAR